MCLTMRNTTEESHSFFYSPLMYIFSAEAQKAIERSSQKELMTFLLDRDLCFENTIMKTQGSDQNSGKAV